MSYAHNVQCACTVMCLSKYCLSLSVHVSSRLSLIWMGALTFTHVCVDSSQTVLEHNTPFNSCICFDSSQTVLGHLGSFTPFIHQCVHLHTLIILYNIIFRIALHSTLAKTSWQSPSYAAQVQRWLHITQVFFTIKQTH